MTKSKTLFSELIDLSHVYVFLFYELMKRRKMTL